MFRKFWYILLFSLSNLKYVNSTQCLCEINTKFISTHRHVTIILYTPLCNSALKRKFVNFFYLFSKICIFIFSHNSITTCTQIPITVIRHLSDSIVFTFGALYMYLLFPLYIKKTICIILYKVILYLILSKMIIQCIPLHLYNITCTLKY